MSMTVLSVAYPFARVTPYTAGGAEQVLATLDKAVVAQSYLSLVVAREGSVTRGRLFATRVPEGVLSPAVQAEVTAAHQAGIGRALGSASVDLVHMHGIDFHRYRLPQDMPVLVTLHLPPAWYPNAIWSLPENYTLQCVSESQRRACPERAQGRLRVIENGVALGAPVCVKEQYALLLARICPEKNLHTGLDAARLARMPAVLAGEAFPYPAHLAYMEREIKPRLSETAT